MYIYAHTHCIYACRAPNNNEDTDNHHTKRVHKIILGMYPGYLQLYDVTLDYSVMEHKRTIESKTCIYVCTYLCVYTCVHICVHVCMNVYIALDVQALYCMSFL